MGRKTVKTLAKKAPKVIFETTTGKKLEGVAKTQRAKLKKKNSSYVVDDDAIKLMRRQLADVGCNLHEVEADGNCLFRALGDQLYGDQQKHEEVREKIVDYIEQHREDFEPFMEDEEKFEKYCERMGEDGTWGGNQELYAAARLYQVYVVVHQDQPSARIMVIECDRLKPTRFAHIAYHGEDHYDSVRALKDPVDFKSLPVSIDLDCDGFRAEDFAKRWQTHAPASGLVSEDQLEQRVVPKSSTDEVDRLARSLGEQVQVASGTGNTGAAGKTLSKKEQRKAKKAKDAARSASRKQALTSKYSNRQAVVESE